MFNSTCLLIISANLLHHSSRTNLSAHCLHSEGGQHRAYTRDLRVYSSALWMKLLTRHHWSKINIDSQIWLCIDMFLQREDHLLHQPVQGVPKDYIQPRHIRSSKIRQYSTLKIKHFERIMPCSRP